MDAISPSEVTALLEAHRGGDETAYARLVSLLYDELRRLARRQRRRLRPGETLDTTSLLHEAYLKLGGGDGSWESRSHFFAAASRVMRHILVDAARARRSAKRGRGKVPATLGEHRGAEQRHAEDVLAVDAAIEKLQELEERLGSVVECRFFGGMTEEETAQALGVSARTVRRDWLRARGWLRKELGRSELPAAGPPAPVS